MKKNCQILALMFLLDMVLFTYGYWGLVQLLEAIAVEVSLLSIFSDTDFTRLAQYVARVALIALIVYLGISAYPFWSEITDKIISLFPLKLSYWKILNLQDIYFMIVDKVIESNYLFSMTKTIAYLVSFDFFCFLLLRPIVKIGRIVVTYFSFSL